MNHETNAPSSDAVVPLDSWRTLNQPIITGDVTLRPWRLADRDFIAEAFADPEIMRWHSFTHRAPDEWLRERIAAWSGGERAEWAVEFDGQLAGRINLHLIDVDDRTCAVGYFVHPAWRGRGVASASLRALTRWTLRQGMHRIALEHAVANHASCAVASRCGYPFEGIARQASRRNGEWDDMHVHAIIAGDPLL